MDTFANAGQSPSVESVHLADADAFAKAVPHETFAVLRRDDPIHWTDEEDGPGFWSVTRHADITAVHRDPKTFAPQPGDGPYLYALKTIAGKDGEAAGSYMWGCPDLRGVVQRWLSGEQLAAHESIIRSQVGRVIDDALEQQQTDFAAEIATGMSIRAFVEILGAPADHYRYLVRLGQRLLAAGDSITESTGHLRTHAQLQFNTAASEMRAYARALAMQRRKRPNKDLISALVKTRINGSELTAQAIDHCVLLLAIACNETTRHALSLGLLAYFKNPEERQRLVTNPQLSAPAAEEVLRWTTPVHHLRRTVNAEFKFHGKQLRRGQTLTTWLVSGNRDAFAFCDPFRFDIARSPNPHLTFGPADTGSCLGSGLARVVIRAAFAQLFAKAGEIEVSGPVERLRSSRVNGIKRLPVTLQAAS